MSLRLRLLLLLLLICVAGGYLLIRWSINQVRPRYLESIEESLVDTSTLLAAVLEADSGSSIDAQRVAQIYNLAARREFTAKVFSITKTHLDLRVYVTDANGRVVFDSTGRNEGRDFSHWNDVYRTLHGSYGARSTRDIPGDDNTQVLYVAAPVRKGDHIIGVVSVGKPTRGINQLVAAAQEKIFTGALLGGAILIGALLVAASWVIGPIERLTAYARAVRDGRTVTLPSLPGRTLQDLGTAFEEMRDTLEGRQHAERYTRALAHEVKAPLAAIRGAAELLDEEMPSAQRAKFLANIRQEGARIEAIIERLLELSSLETRKGLGQAERIDPQGLLAEAVDSIRAAYGARQIDLRMDVATAPDFVGDRFLLRQALLNLLQNALDFSPPGGAVECRLQSLDHGIEFAIRDRGPGVPDYALPRVFDRFYSLPRPSGGAKSTGIGLALVREIAHLHQGRASLENCPDGGACARLWIPLTQS